MVKEEIVEVNGLDGKTYEVVLKPITYGEWRKIRKMVDVNKDVQNDIEGLVLMSSIKEVREKDTGKKVKNIEKFLDEKLDFISGLKLEEKLSEIYPLAFSKS